MVLDRTKGISKVNAIRKEWTNRNMTGKKSRKSRMKVTFYVHRRATHAV
jgi:hypothetical protein